MRSEGSELLSARMKNKRGAKSHKNEENKVKLTFYQLYLVSKYKTSNREQLSLKINRDFTVSRTNLKIRTTSSNLKSAILVTMRSRPILVNKYLK